jgi:DHA2 family multidrug resistance protein
MPQGQSALAAIEGQGMPREAATTVLSAMVEGQSVMLATLDMFAATALCFAFAAILIWLAPKPQGPIDTSGAH